MSEKYPLLPLVSKLVPMVGSSSAAIGHVIEAIEDLGDEAAGDPDLQEILTVLGNSSAITPEQKEKIAALQAHKEPKSDGDDD